MMNAVGGTSHPLQQPELAARRRGPSRCAAARSCAATAPRALPPGTTLEDMPVTYDGARAVLRASRGVRDRHRRQGGQPQRHDRPAPGTSSRSPRKREYPMPALRLERLAGAAATGRQAARLAPASVAPAAVATRSSARTGPRARTAGSARGIGCHSGAKSSTDVSTDPRRRADRATSTLVTGARVTRDRSSTATGKRERRRVRPRAGKESTSSPRAPCPARGLRVGEHAAAPAVEVVRVPERPREQPRPGRQALLHARRPDDVRAVPGPRPSTAGTARARRRCTSTTGRPTTSTTPGSASSAAARSTAAASRSRSASTAQRRRRTVPRSGAPPGRPGCSGNVKKVGSIGSGGGTHRRRRARARRAAGPQPVSASARASTARSTGTRRQLPGPRRARLAAAPRRRTDGPMLELPKGALGARLVVPTRRAAQPDRARLAARIERFSRAASRA